MIQRAVDISSKETWVHSDFKIIIIWSEIKKLKENYTECWLLGFLPYVNITQCFNNESIAINCLGDLLK